MTTRSRIPNGSRQNLAEALRYRGEIFQVVRNNKWVDLPYGSLSAHEKAQAYKHVKGYVEPRPVGIRPRNSGRFFS